MNYFEQNWPVALIVIFFGYKFLKNKKTKKELQKILKAPCQIIDVRSTSEFQRGHAPSSINIPLDTIKTNVVQIRKDVPVIIVCKSGTRSGMAKMALKNMGYINVMNGGPWQNVLIEQI